ncbi:hypothetical protein ACTHQY_17520 [Rhodococcoides corynebacterioides]|uniref:hypothetical protein n=1 Tax=Rhodococcoides corynebacterioides TaxID=53972 RepID=UPI003F7E63A0
MSTDEKQTPEETPEKTDETVGPELSQEDLDRAGEKMDGLNDRYETGARETVTLPGTNGTVSGTAFADMVDEDGNAKNESGERTEDDQPA